MEEKNYKKLYEDVVALAKDGLKDGLYLSQSAKAVTEFLFPQLKETEDEKVKRELTRFLIDFNSGYYSRPSESKIDSWIKWIDEKCEQKPTDKVGPKFKVGDWITNGACIIKITSIDDRYYWHDNDCVGGDIESIDKEYHLWTIQDAKDGDVLATKKGNPFIYDKDRYNNGLAYYYAGLDVNKELTLKSPHHMLAHFGELHSVSPATKEQRDLLFQKMKEAGYEWDAENKKLNKIEQESTWNEKIKGLNELETYILSLVPDRSLDAIKVDAKNIRYIINKEQKPAEWSEKDAKILNEIIDELTPYGECPDYPSPEEQEYYYTRTSMIDWLKSIKDRVQPQSKQEWSEEDKSMYIRTLGILGKCYMGELPTKVEEELKWFKSITDKAQPQTNQYDKGYEDGYSAAKYNQWKPKKEELEALRKRTYFCEGIDANLDSLYTNLLKL